MQLGQAEKQPKKQNSDFSHSSAECEDQKTRVKKPKTTDDTWKLPEENKPCTSPVNTIAVDTIPTKNRVQSKDQTIGAWKWR